MVDFLKLAQPGITELSPYQPGKPIEELERELGIVDIIKLASNENPLGPSRVVIESITGQLAELARYPDGSAYQLKDKLQAKLGIDPAMVTVGNGSNDVLELVARVFLGPGLESIVSEHSFVVYPLVTKSLGAELIVIPAIDFGQDLNATRASIGDRTRVIFIANPNNPTGTWVDKQSLLSFLDAVPEKVLVVLDEAYAEYVAEPDYPNGLELVDDYPNLIVTRTFSKAYGLAGLRMGYSVSHPDIADLMNRVRQPFNVNAMSLAAALVALDDEAYLKESVRVNNEGMKMLTDACDQLGLGYIPSVGNFLTIDFGCDAMPIYDGLLQEGVIVRPIGVYGLPNHLRVTVGLPLENKRFIDSLKKLLGAGVKKTVSTDLKQDG
jgi:histidinol-phosphate aminotransferase|tara:strand:- start:593 stop:1735 length:1143 start_codon:yes stop_codon:yes gene_type:complete